MKSFLLYLWCLPQNLLGLALRLFYKDNAMNFGHTNGEGIYMAMGGLNLIAGIWTAYQAYRNTLKS